MIKLAQETQQKDAGYVFSPRDIVNALRFLLVAYMYNIKDTKSKWVTEIAEKFRSTEAPKSKATKSRLKTLEEKDIHTNAILVALKYTCTQLVRKADPDEQEALADIVNGCFSQMIGDIKVEN